VARVFITRALPFPAIDRLRAAHDVDVWEDDLPPPRPALLERARPVDGLLTMLSERVDDELLDAAPDLRVIANYAVGSDNVDLRATRRRRIPVGVTPDVLTDATADLAMALLLAAARHLPQAGRAVREGRWRTWEPDGWLGLELAGATLAVVGAGRIGSAVARRAEAFGMRVLTVGREDSLHDALAQADAISLHVPLTTQTRHLIDHDALEATRRGAILVNTARGPIVDQAALATALREGRLAAAGLDVTDPEPLPADDPLLDAPNLIVVPHIGSATRTARERMAERAVDNLLAGLEGRPLPHPATA
jgi:glyoxylate reductase